MIPLRPELVEFMDPRSLCHYSRTSKTLCKDVSDLKAWDLLARAQVPRSVPGPSALARVQSHVRRRLLADALGQETPSQMRTKPFEDYTFFVRFEEDGVIIWEGDLKGWTDPWEDCRIPLDDAWSEITQSDTWPNMEKFLTTPTRKWDLDTGAEIYLKPIKITVVAIRDEDQAMVSLGCLPFHEPSGTEGYDLQH